MGVHLEPSYAEVVSRLETFDTRLGKRLSDRISAAAKPVVAEMRSTLKGTNSDARLESRSAGSGRRSGRSAANRRADFAVRNSTTNFREAVESGKRLINTRTWNNRRMQARSLRSQIAAGVRMVNRKTGVGGGVTIRTSASRLPPDQKSLPRAFNRGKWRHPLFGNRDFWVEQTATPKGWFYEPAKRSKPRMYREVSKAVEQAVEEMAARLG